MSIRPRLSRCEGPIRTELTIIEHSVPQRIDSRGCLSPLFESHWGQGIEPRSTVVISIGPSGAIQDRAHDLEAAIDRGGGYARRHPVRNKQLECAVMDSIH